MNTNEVLKLALEALRKARRKVLTTEECHAVIMSIKEAMAEQQEPTVEDNSQNWLGMDGATAYWLIQRHADGWADVDKMMSEWLEANQTKPAQQEPVAWMSDVGSVASAHEKKMGYVLGSAFTTPLYTSPPASKPLTDEEIVAVIRAGEYDSMEEFARAIEAAHGIKGDA